MLSVHLCPSTSRFARNRNIPSKRLRQFTLILWVEKAQVLVRFAVDQQGCLENEIFNEFTFRRANEGSVRGPQLIQPRGSVHLLKKVPSVICTLNTRKTGRRKEQSCRMKGTYPFFKTYIRMVLEKFRELIEKEECRSFDRMKTSF